MPSAEYVEAKMQSDLEKGLLFALEGTVQRVNYPRRELTVIAGGELWRFRLAPDCQLWFDDRQAILRCFHPLDRARIIFARTPQGNEIRAMYAWDRQPV